MFLVWKTTYIWSVLPKLIHRFNAISMKIQVRFYFFVDINTFILKFIWENKRITIAKTNLKKNKMDGFTPHNFKA